MTSPLDPTTRLILDFVYRYESGGNYNAYYGHGTNTTIRLVDMTISEIVAFQDQMLAGGSRSTAIGAPQFLKATLLSLNPVMAARFTPEYQDALAVILLVRRGYSSWWSGKISDQTFAYNLSLEWASMPDPEKNGLSHYDGQKVRYTVGQVYAALAQARALIAPAGPAPSIPRPTLDPALVAETQTVLGRLQAALAAL